jgi:hypothetical protein
LSVNQLGNATFDATETGYVGTYTVTSDNTSVVTIPTSPITATGNVTTITINAVAPGTANVTVKDSNNESVVVPVTVTTTPITINSLRRHH